ncbi:Putative F-box-like domain superfamily protein [Septoria linicola]|uniref:F-box-like domain superfamily protein n=1 Tax=Septoria linicola TaxID=215465 RepID=A0A9Q9B5M2_9PEZI|nr:putative F-box-like domain superfamily protein [Septoria linicola]USW56771.1 Putative F-box-like domain superfamily protein [Septoria linicola]
MNYVSASQQIVLVFADLPTIILIGKNMEDLFKLPQKLQKLAMRPIPRVSSAPQVAASIRLVAITELVEHILLDVDPGTLLQAQRVNRLFHRVLQSSPSFRQKLWLEPPMIANEEEPMVVNPMIQAHLHQLGIVDIEISSHTNLDLPIVRTTFEHRCQLAMLKPGSWRDMILADVFDCHNLDCMAIWHRTVPEQRHSERIAGIVMNAPPVKLGDLVDALLAMRIGVEGFDFEDSLAASQRQRQHRG